MRSHEEHREALKKAWHYDRTLDMRIGRVLMAQAEIFIDILEALQHSNGHEAALEKDLDRARDAVTEPEPLTFTNRMLSLMDKAREPVTREHLCDQMGASASTVGATLSRLRGSGRVVEVGDGYYAATGKERKGSVE